MSFSYANPASGPSAGSIGWFNFANIVMNPGDTLTGLGGTLMDGSTVTFDLAMSLVSGPARAFGGSPVPTYSGARFGTLGYTGILGNAALYETAIIPSAGAYAFTMSNIVLKDAGGNAISNYTAVVADAESTNLLESWVWNTNGGGWKQLAALGATFPVLTGLGTPTATMTGTAAAGIGAYVLTTQTPTQMVLTANNAINGRQAFSVGFAVTKVTVQKNIGARIDSSDQFVVDIAGTPNAQATTAGILDGIQSETAQVFAIPGNVYTINEAMAPLSASALTDYNVVVSAVNNALGGTIPPTGTLPINFTPALGDDVVYTILNAAPETFIKTVDKAFTDIGEVLTYTVTVNNTNNFTVNNVLVTDLLPAGTTYIGNLIVSAPFTGVAPATGITIASIGANDAVTLSWQVKVNSSTPVTTPITNIATVTVPGGTSGVTNITQTQVVHAFVSTQKSVDKTSANVGDTLTYTLLLNNLGNTAANNIVITDPVPAGTTYVAGSATGTVAFTGTPLTTISLTAPIAVGGSATITYKVKAASAIPAVNPISNTASIVYDYTVDPAAPNGVSATGTSNTATTQISNATLKTVKKSDKVFGYIGDIITYQVAITNTGNVPADNIVLTDPVPNGTVYVLNSLASNVAFTGSPMTNIQLTNPIAPGETVSLSYQLKVVAIPNPNPIVNTMTAAFAYTVNPLSPNGVLGTSVSNAVDTLVFKNNYSQEISDLIHSIALQEAAIGNIANAEGAKIQRMLALGASTNELLCVNKSVTDMLDALGTLESVLKQKLSSVDCQISPSCM